MRNRTELDAALDTRTVAAARLAAATNASERGRAAHEAPVAKSSRLDTAKRAWIDSEALRLQAVYPEGRCAPLSIRKHSGAGPRRSWDSDVAKRLVT
jgi:hypothetical protein